MFKRKVFPPRFLNNMNFQCKGCYGKENCKAVSVLMYIEPSGTRRETILQQSSNNSQENLNPHDRSARMPLDNHFP